MNYSQILRRYLEETQTSVDDLAQKSDVHRTTIYRALKGKDLNFKKLKALLGHAGYEIEAVPTPTPPEARL